MLDIGEQLAPVLSEVESQCREKVYPAEEEYEGGRGRGGGREREEMRRGKGRKVIVRSGV